MPKNILYILVFILVVFQQFPSYDADVYERGEVHTIYENPVEWIKISPFELCIVAGFILVLFNKTNSIIIQKRFLANRLYIILIAIVILLGIFWGIVNGIGIFPILNQVRSIFYPFLIIFIIQRTLNNTEEIYALLKFMFSLSIFVGFYGLFLFLTGKGRLTLLGSQIIFYDFASLYVLSFSIIYYFLIYLKKKSIIEIFTSFMWFVPILISFFFSYRRSAYVGILLACILIVFLYYKNIFKIFVKAVLLCIVLYGLISFTQSKNIDNVVDEFATILIMDESNASNYFRLLEIDLVYTQVTANPLIGKGWGSRYDIYGVPQSTMEFMNDVNIVVHNSYLAIWFKTGLPGLLCFLFIVFMPLIQIVKLIIRNKLFENNYDMLLLCSGMIVVILFDFIIGPQIFHIRTTALAAIFYGLGIKMVGIHGRV